MIRVVIVIFNMILCVLSGLCIIIGTAMKGKKWRMTTISSLTRSSATLHLQVNYLFAQ